MTTTTLRECNGFRMRLPDNFHGHLRSGAIMRAVIALAAKRFARYLAMPNEKIGGKYIMTMAQAIEYRLAIWALTQKIFPSFEPLIAFYLTDNADAHELLEGFKRKIFFAVKKYALNATTNSEEGASSIES